MSFWGVQVHATCLILLIEPNIPIVGMEITADDAGGRVWLNGKVYHQYQ